MKVLKRTEFGNPILRKVAQALSQPEITSTKIQTLISDMRYTLEHEKLGVGLAAPQVGKNISLAIIHIRPTPHRPKVKNFDAVLINPKIIETYGKKIQEWEGCISAGPMKAGMFAKVPRYKAVRLKYYDEAGKLRSKKFEGLAAQVAQHETDHLNGVLFVDKVKDTKTYMTYAEYIKRVRNKKTRL